MSLHYCALWMLVFQFLSRRRYAVTIEILVSLGRAACTYVSVNVVGRNRGVSIWMHNTKTIKLLYIIWKCQTTTRTHTTSKVGHTPLRNSAQGTRFHEQLSPLDNTAIHPQYGQNCLRQSYLMETKIPLSRNSGIALNSGTFPS